MKDNFFKDIQFEIKEWNRRRKKKKEYKSFKEIDTQREKKTQSDIDRESAQWLTNRKFKG